MAGVRLDIDLDASALRPLIRAVAEEVAARLERTAATGQPAHATGGSATLLDGKLLLTAKQAAEVLSISERTLYTLSAPRGPIPVVPIGGGRNLRYPVDGLRAFIAKHALVGDAGPDHGQQTCTRNGNAKVQSNGRPTP